MVVVDAGGCCCEGLGEYLLVADVVGEHEDEAGVDGGAGGGVAVAVRGEQLAVEVVGVGEVGLGD